jgi:outer membrane protein assembly factor BamD
MRIAATILALSVLLTACASVHERDQHLNAHALYSSVQANLAAGNYKLAISRLHTMESRFPFGGYSDQARLDLIYAYYLEGDTESAVDDADDFIRENPRYPHVDYVYYMKGLAYFDSDPNNVAGLFNTVTGKSTPTDARKAFQAFQQLVQRFPKSKYAADARKRMVYLRNRLAGFETQVANFYLRRHAYVAAIRRAQFAIDHYPEAAKVQNALVIMLKAYRKLNMQKLAADTRHVLQASYPDWKQHDHTG